MYVITLETEQGALLAQGQLAQADGVMIKTAIFSEFDGEDHLGDYSLPVNHRFQGRELNDLWSHLQTVSMSYPTLERLAEFGAMISRAEQALRDIPTEEPEQVL